MIKGVNEMQGDMRVKEIAVIGGGAGCVAFLHHFVERISCSEKDFIKIVIVPFHFSLFHSGDSWKTPPNP